METLNMSERLAGFRPAYAKINYTLDVLGKRDDGYHRLASVMQTLALHDTLAVRPRDDGEIALVCDAPALDVPANLALRAALRLRASAAEPLSGVTLELHKCIPAQAGLGGGSSDAAAALLALDSYWGLHLGPDVLGELAAQLGSDVPFFLHGGTALIGGRGEIVEPLPPAEPLWIVLVKPPIDISTAAVFQALTPASYSSGADSEALAAAIRAGRPLPFDHLSNALEAGVVATYPPVTAALEGLREAGAPIARLSGSGPTVYAPFRDLKSAARVYAGVREAGFAAWLTHTL
jgi:4-diphosphocytidyl-2-C-methyl-D-erythritol kinase